MIRKRFTFIAAGLASGFALLSSAALADVKAGVDAWAAGEFARAVAEWKGPAAQGDPDALFNLAQAYRLGRGVPEDAQQAESLYARAAAKGHLQAADNYGLLLFQGGKREQALPYIRAAAERGDPRAQYLMGIAHFNGDLMPKDWVRAYALLTLANGAALPQAASAIAQMDQFIPLEQRQQAQTLAAQLRTEADARRASQMAASDLGQRGPAAPDGSDAPKVAEARVMPAMPAARMPQAVPSIAADPSIASAEAAVAEAMRATGGESPAEAGADFARPAPLAAASPPRLAPVPKPAPRSADDGASTNGPAPTASASGPWKVQLGAFGVAGNADRLWSQLAGKPMLAGKAKQTIRSGKFTRLVAAGWASEGAAQSACSALKAIGQGCLVIR
jgi:hypothetical protein